MYKDEAYVRDFTEQALAKDPEEFARLCQLAKEALEEEGYNPSSEEAREAVIDALVDFQMAQVAMAQELFPDEVMTRMLGEEIARNADETGEARFDDVHRTLVSRAFEELGKAYPRHFRKRGGD